VKSLFQLKGYEPLI